MKIYISYYYNLRFLKPYQIPVSTTIWDPKWFHNFKGQNEVFVDKNGVINGLRIENLNPGSCHAVGCPCSGIKDGEAYKNCYFLKSYRKGLEQQDFNIVIQTLQNMIDAWKIGNDFEQEPEIVLMVYETPDNPCSEREPLIEWFRKNGYELDEWKKEENVLF